MDEEVVERIRQEIGPLYDAASCVLYVEETTYAERVAKLAEKHVEYFKENITNHDDYNFEVSSLVTALTHFSKIYSPLQWKILLKNLSYAFDKIQLDDNDER